MVTTWVAVLLCLLGKQDYPEREDYPCSWFECDLLSRSGQCGSGDPSGALLFPLGIMRRVIQSTAELGRAIRAERKALDLTQGDLAAACGVSLRFLSELERGRASAGIDRVLRVLGMLGLEVVLESPRGD